MNSQSTRFECFENSLSEAKIQSNDVFCGNNKLYFSTMEKTKSPRIHAKKSGNCHSFFKRKIVAKYWL